MAHKTKTHQDLSFPVIVKFWGVRGSFPTQDVRIGGHTTCLTLKFADQLIIFDTGSGMIDLGDQLLSPSFPPGTSVKDVEIFMKLWLSKPNVKLDDLGAALQEQFKGHNGGVHATVIHSHVHKDHLDGITAFKPVFMPSTDLHMIGATHDGLTIPEIMERFVFAPPVFPMPWGKLASKRTHQQIKPGEKFTIPCSLGDIKVRILQMNHPNEAYCYRFEWRGKVIAVALDHEHGHEFDKNVVEIAEGADLVITEAQYTNEQYARCAGYGHVSESAAAAHVKAAKAKLCYTTHHDPNATYDDVQQIARTIQEHSGVETRLAWQGSEIHV